MQFDESDSTVAEDVNDKPKKLISIDKLMEKLNDLLKQADQFNIYLNSKKRRCIAPRQEAPDGQKRKRRWLKPQQREDEENSTAPADSYLVKQPSILKGGMLKDYQMEALNWMISLREVGLNGILADDMGLGKTIQSISFLAYLSQFKKIRGPTLVVAPLTTLSNWEREFKTWLPSLRSVLLFATEKERNKTFEKVIKYSNFDVIITSYQGILTCYNWLQKIQWKTMIIDEAHRIKNDESKISSALRNYLAQFKLLMTGTPLSNDLHELWSLLNFILPDIFHEAKVFDDIHSAVELLIGEEKQRIQVEIAEKIHQILAPFMKRRTKKQVQTTLPGKTEMTLYISLTPLQVQMYRNYAKYQNPKGKSIEHYKNSQVQMRKICCHPYLFDGIEPENQKDPMPKLIEVSGKMIVLDKLLRKLLKENHKILIFSQFTVMLDILEDYCTYRSYPISRIDGTMPLQERQKHIERFNTNQDYKIFLISTKAGGLGINLVAADVVIVYDMDWNPQNDNQAIDRAYRIGQTKPVQVYKFICEYSIQERMSEVQKMKLVWDDLVIQKGAIFLLKSEPQVKAAQINKLAQLGIGDIFRIEGKVSDQDIDEIINMGKEKDKQKLTEIRKKLQVKLQQQMGTKGHSSFNPLNLMERRSFNNRISEMDDDEMDEQVKQYLRKRNDVKQTRRSSSFQQQKIIVPFYHLYRHRCELEECKGKLSVATDKHRTELLQRIKILQNEGFCNWTINDYDKFIDANIDYPKNKYKQIAAIIKNKTIKEVENYSKAFYKRASGVVEMKKDLRKVLNAQDRMDKRIYQQEIIEWKRKHYTQQVKMLPNSNYTFKYIDNCIAKFLIEHFQEWEDIDLLREYLDKELGLQIMQNQDLQDDKFLTKKLYKMMDIFQNERDEIYRAEKRKKHVDNINELETKPKSKSKNLTKSKIQVQDKCFRTVCNFFIHFNKKESCVDEVSNIKQCVTVKNDSDTEACQIVGCEVKDLQKKIKDLPKPKPKNNIMNKKQSDTVPKS